MTVQVAVFQTSALGNATYGALLEQEMARDTRVCLSFNWIDQPDHGSLGWAIRSVGRTRNLDFGHFRRDLVMSALADARRRAMPVRPDVSIYSTPSLAYFRPKGVYGVILDKTSRISERWWQPVRGTMYPNHRAEERAYRDAAFVVGWSKGAAQSVIQDYGCPASQVSVVNPGVDLVRIQPVAKSNDGPLRLLFIGGDLRRKGGPSVLRVVDRLRGGVHLDLVSPAAGPFASANVTPHTSVRPYTAAWYSLLAGADILVVPSSEEPFGLVYLEAMAAGLPVVMANTLAAPDIVGDSDAGRVVTAGDDAELLAVVSALMRDRVLVERMARAARSRAEERFDAAANMKAISTLAIEAMR